MPLLGMELLPTATWRIADLPVPSSLWGQQATLSFRASADPAQVEGTSYNDLIVDHVRFVPEPATLGLLTVGGLAVLLRRKRK